jgi:hypothetical protein
MPVFPPLTARPAPQIAHFVDAQGNLPNGNVFVGTVGQEIFTHLVRDHLPLINVGKKSWNDIFENELCGQQGFAFEL